LTFALALALSLTTAAQTSSTESKQEASPNQRQTDSAGNLHRDRVGERLEWLSQQLNLTEDQKKQLKPVLAGEFKQMRAVGEDVSLTQDQKREKMKQIHEASRPQVQAILTPEQQQNEGRSQRATRRQEGQRTERPPTTTVVPNRAGAARKARFQACVSERLAIISQTNRGR
jgi:Spy/CpxP family protein refolding chaperone